MMVVQPAGMGHPGSGVSEGVGVEVTDRVGSFVWLEMTGRMKTRVGISSSRTSFVGVLKTSWLKRFSAKDNKTPPSMIRLVSAARTIPHKTC
jgi:hypothetical protein